MYYTDFFKGYIKNYFKDSNFSGDYTHEDGTKASYINGKLSYIEYSNGIKQWFNKTGKFHREDGPAIEYSNGRKEWWIDSVCLELFKLHNLIKTSIFLGKEKEVKKELEKSLSILDLTTAKFTEEDKEKYLKMLEDKRNKRKRTSKLKI